MKFFAYRCNDDSLFYPRISSIWCSCCRHPWRRGFAYCPQSNPCRFLSSTSCGFAVFPPFLNPRTVPAVGVIFRESPVLLRKKRGSTLNNLVHEVKKMWAKFQKRLQCVGPTLTRKFSRNSRRVSRRRHIPFQHYNRRHKRDLDTVAHFVRK